MPTEAYDAEGNPIEGVLTESEAKHMAEEQANAIVKEKTEAAEKELNDTKALLAQREEELGKIKGKDGNISNIKKEKQEEIDALKKTLEGLEGKLNETMTATQRTALARDIEKIVGDDPEMVAKVEHYYSTFTGTPKDAKERAERLQNAVLLATGGTRRVSAESIAGGSGQPPRVTVDTKGKISSEANDPNFLRNLGISPEDSKKYNII